MTEPQDDLPIPDVDAIVDEEPGDDSAPVLKEKTKPPTPVDGDTLGADDDEAGGEKKTEITPKVMRKIEIAGTPNLDLFRDAVDDEAELAKEIPPWVKLPEEKNFKMPGKGRLVWFMRFRARLTDAPHKGERQCILWSLTEEDEKIAITRTWGNNALIPAEMGKMMIRAVDGRAVNWDGNPTPASGKHFWREIGAAYRQMIINNYLMTHTLKLEDRVDFFDDCLAVRTVG